MNNNDILIRLRYALDIKDQEMVKIFKLGGIDISILDVRKILSKESYQNEDENSSYIRENEEYIPCDNDMLDGFLNGLITYKRGEPKDTQSKTPPLSIEDDQHVNNVLLKKLKIALTLTSEDMLDIFNKAGISVSKSELSAVLRRRGQRNYKECGDRYARNFLKGLAVKYR